MTRLILRVQLLHFFSRVLICRENSSILAKIIKSHSTTPAQAKQKIEVRRTSELDKLLWRKKRDFLSFFWWRGNKKNNLLSLIFFYILLLFSTVTIFFLGTFSVRMSKGKNLIGFFLLPIEHSMLLVEKIGTGFLHSCTHMKLQTIFFSGEKKRKKSKKQMMMMIFFQRKNRRRKKIHRVKFRRRFRRIHGAENQYILLQRNGTTRVISVCSSYTCSIKIYSEDGRVLLGGSLAELEFERWWHGLYYCAVRILYIFFFSLKNDF